MMNRKARQKPRISKVHEGAEIPEYPDMTFTREDCKGISFPYFDPLVMIVEIVELPVYRVLIDTGAEVNVIYKSCWDRMDAGGATPGESNNSYSWLLSGVNEIQRESYLACNHSRQERNHHHFPTRVLHH